MNMKLSKTALGFLSKQYRLVLKKCFLINLGLWTALAMPAMADGSEAYVVKEDTEIPNEIQNENPLYYSSLTVNEKANLSVTGSKIKVLSSLEVKNGATLTMKQSSIDLSSDDDYSYKNKADFDGATVYMTDSELPVDGELNIKNSEFKVAYNTGTTHDYQIEARYLTIDNSKISLSDYRPYPDNYGVTDEPSSVMAAKDTLTIKNKSDVTLNGNAILAFNGQVYVEDDDGYIHTVASDNMGIYIDDSTLTLNDNSRLSVGMDDDEGADLQQGKLSISNSEITLNDSASIAFNLNNKEETTISDTKITLNDKSSMSLNELSLVGNSVINLKDSSTLNVTNVSLGENSQILGHGNAVTFDGSVDFAGYFDPAAATVKGTLARSGYDDKITYTILGGTLTYAKDQYLYDDSSKYGLNTILFKSGTLDLANGKASTIKLAELSLSGKNDVRLDADLAGKTMDNFGQTKVAVEEGAQLNISKLNLVSDAADETTVINFTKDEDLLKATSYTGQASGLTALSPVYSYDVVYDQTSGDFTFSRNGNNPAVYAASVSAGIVASLQSNISAAAFKGLDTANVRSDSYGMSSGDLSAANNVWVSVFGLDDDVDMGVLNSVDSKTMSLVGGVNSDQTATALGNLTYGVFAGYLNGEQKYSGNKISQDGGYLGLVSEVRNHEAFVQGILNGGYMDNEAKSSFGKDSFDTYWLGVSFKAGYDYALTPSVIVEPNLYVGYTFADTEDYTSKSGARIDQDNLHLFEVAPGLKVSKDFGNEWNGFAQAKYAFVSDSGGDTNANNVSLPNVSNKDYVEYGLGVEKSLANSWSISANINRRDGGREGWNGSLTAKYEF
jgi:hypothetical protein